VFESCRGVVVGVLRCFALLDRVGLGRRSWLFWRGGLRGQCELACIEGGAEVLREECVVEEVAEVGVHNVVLGIAVVAEEDGVELPAVLLR